MDREQKNTVQSESAGLYKITWRAKAARVCADRGVLHRVWYGLPIDCGELSGVPVLRKAFSIGRISFPIENISDCDISFYVIK